MDGITTRNNPLCIISKNTFGEYNIRDIQINSGWNTNPHKDDYAIVPDNMVQDVLATGGFCDIVLNDDETEIVSFVPRKIPNIPEPAPPITKTEQLRADIDFIAIMTGVKL